jgi:hypothetical protein
MTFIPDDASGSRKVPGKAPFGGQVGDGLDPEALDVFDALLFVDVVAADEVAPDRRGAGGKPSGREMPLELNTLPSDFCSRMLCPPVPEDLNGRDNPGLKPSLTCSEP